MKLKKTKSQKFRRGSLLAFVLVIGVCLALLGFGMLELGFGSRLQSAISVYSINAREAADAGIAKALYEMNRHFVPGVGWDGTLPPDATSSLANSMATYTYHVDYFPTPAVGGPYWLITSTGTSGRETRRVFARVGIINLFDYGLIVTDIIKLLNNNVIDGYDSRRGPYTFPPDNSNSYGHVKIGTTSTAGGAIWLGSDTRITGDVLAGIGGDVDEVITNPSGAAITGPWYNLPTPWYFSPVTVTVPPGVPSSGSIGVSSPWDATGSITIGTPGVPTYWRYNNIDVPNGRSVILVGPVEMHITGDLLLANSAALYIGNPLDPTVQASATIYLDGNLNVSNGAAINNLSRIPARFWLWGTGAPYQTWDIKNSGDYFGIYYGQNANIHTYASAQFYGSVSGHEFILNSDAGLHYDQALSDISTFDKGFGIERWWEEIRP